MSKRSTAVENAMRPLAARLGCASGPVPSVTRWGVPPSAGIRQSALVPSRAAAKYTHRPSGDQAGSVFAAWSVVSGRGAPPAAGTSHRSRKSA